MEGEPRMWKTWLPASGSELPAAVAEVPTKPWEVGVEGIEVRWGDEVMAAKVRNDDVVGEEGIGSGEAREDDTEWAGLDQFFKNTPQSSYIIMRSTTAIPHH